MKTRKTPRRLNQKWLFMTCSVSRRFNRPHHWISKSCSSIFPTIWWRMALSPLQKSHSTLKEDEECGNFSHSMFLKKSPQGVGIFIKFQ